MNEKEKQVMNHFEKIMSEMTDKKLEKFLLIGEGMAIMSGIKDKKKIQESIEIFQPVKKVM